MKNQFSIMIISLLLISIASCKPKSNIDESKNLVKAEAVKIESNERIISYPGKVIAASDVNLSFRIAGPISKINVVQGQKVKKGDILAEIDERDYKLQLSATEAEYKQIKAEAERVMELYSRGSATQNDHDKAYYGLEQISAKYSAHKNALADTKLKAPFDGYIQKIYFESSETIGAGMPVLSLVSSSAPEIEINLPASDFVKRGDFDETYCIIPAYNNEKYTLQLIDIAKKANLNQLYAARFLVVSSSKEKPFPGMSANVFIKYISHNEQYYSVPVTSIFEKEGKSYVWVINNENKLVSKMVTPSEIKKDGRVFISSGVKDGEKVVIAGVKHLTEGQSVKIKASSSKTNVGNIL